jgi:hypothetical protein
VKTFDLKDIESKQFFPHLFNTESNLQCPTLPKLPPKASYLFRSMKMEKRQQFLRWYAQNKHQPFDLRQELFNYCMSDVRILSTGLVRYRELLLEECNGLEVLQKTNTLASAVMMHYRMNLMPTNTIAVASELSYDRHDKQSTIARHFLKWFGHKNGVPVQYVDSSEGEKRISPNIYLDGYIPGGLDGQSPDLAIEINGYVLISHMTQI